MEIQHNEHTALPPGYEGLTFEKVWAAIQETNRQLKERMVETDRKFQETGRQMKEEMEKRSEKVDREMEKRKEEFDRQMEKRREEADRQMEKRREEEEKRFQENERLLRQNQKMMSDLGRKFGKIIEHMFIPNLKENFNALGYEFEKSSPNVLIESKDHQIYTEIDVFLENGDCALAVEVKTQANIDDIREHIERMEKLRRYFDLHHDPRKLFGAVAVAAAVMPGNVHDFALKQGFYIINQTGDNLSVEEPPNKAKAW
jgi:hypothetical protein